MIPRTAAIGSLPETGWQAELARAVRDPAELIRRLKLDPELLPAARRAAATFPLRVPHAYLSRIRRGDPRDPLLLQVLPLAAEDETHAGFSLDPLSEAGAQPAPGLVHKYRGRVLLITTPACGVHCRYCFRRHFPYDEALAEAPHWRAACEYIAAHPDIEEVILSGGDPLSLTEQRLQHLGERLTAIPHVRRLRIHTRMPVVLPSRVNDALLGWLADLPLQKIVVIHANHPREIDREVGHALRELATAQVTLLNQSVLLRGINDDAGTLSELSRTLFRYGVLPYYLHLLDRVQGAAHFEVDEARARALHAQLNANLPGYLLPRLVREQAGAPCKTPLSG